MFLLTPRTALPKKKCLLRALSQQHPVCLHASMQIETINTRVYLSFLNFILFFKSSHFLSTNTERKGAGLSSATFHRPSQQQQQQNQKIHETQKNYQKKNCNTSQMCPFVPLTFPLWSLIALNFLVIFFSHVLLQRSTYVENVLCTCTVG